MIIYFLLFIFPLQAFQVKVLENSNHYTEGDYFDSRVEIQSNNDDDVMQFLKSKQIQVHPNLYLVEARLKDNEPIGTFVVTGNRKVEDGVQAIPSLEFTVQPVESKNFYFKNIAHNLFQIPKYVFILLAAILSLALWFIPKWWKKRKAKLEFTLQQKKYLDALQVMNSRKDLESFYVNLNQMKIFLSWEQNNLETFIKKLNEIQYKKDWTKEEENELKNLFKKLVEGTKQNHYGV